MNPEQIEAVNHMNGACRVIAGAGSGKTTVLTKRIEHLIEQGVPPKSILAITFTKKAAEEMKERLIKLVGKQKGEDVFLGTFHSFGFKLLREKMAERKAQNAKDAHGKEIKNISIITEVEQRQIMEKILSPATTVLDKKIENEIDVEVALGFISWQKNFLIFPKDELDMSYLEDEDINESLIEDYRKIYKAYEDLKKVENQFDMDDLLMKAYVFLSKDRVFRRKIQNRYKYILVDEFQDTNVAQYKMVQLMANDQQNVFIVGDARQAIYSWRASKVEFILNFENDWRNARTIELNDNYRSTIEVVDLSTKLIDFSSIDYPGLCRSGRGNHGEPIYSFVTDNEDTEAEFIASIIDDYVNIQKAIKFEDIAILYRLNAQSRAFEDAFMAHNIPYFVAGSKGFYDRREIKELLNYLKLASNPSDTESFENTINVPDRHVSKDIIHKLKEKASFFQQPIVETLSSFWNIDDNPSQEMLLDYVFTIKKIQSMNENENNNVADMLTEMVNNSGYFDFIRQRYKNKNQNDDIDKKIDSLKAFIDSCSRFKNIDELFEYIKRVEEQQANNSKDKVQLMSFHRSKGLEFDTVFMAGMVNGLLPHSKSMKLDKNGRLIFESTEEERRLCYVGITRAKERLFLSSYTSTGKAQAEPSIFFHELQQFTTNISDMYEETKKND